MAATAELGRLCLSDSRADLQLIADVALTASSPSTYTGEASRTDLSAALTAPFSWLCRGRGFHLALHISLNGRQLHGHLQRYLAHSICNADLWRQLNLQAAITQEPLLDRDPSSIAAGILIHLTYLNQDVPLNSRHRLPVAVSAQDVQPPLGVDIVRLTSVMLTLDLSSGKMQKNRVMRNERDMDLQSSPYVLDQPEDMGFLVAGDPQSTTAQEQAMLLDDIQGMMADAPFPTGDGLLHLNPSTAIPQRIDSGTAFADDQISKGGAEHELGQPILELIDSALRLAICEKPPKLPSGVKITRDGIIRLATVSPALWRPNHLKPVSERAPFLPTIAHALSRSLLSNARSASLRRKATELLSRYPSATSHPGPSSPTDAQQCKGPNSVYEAASIGLWNLLQRSHFDSGTNRRLKPLTMRSSNTAAKGFGDADDMLFEISDAWQGDPPPFADPGNSQHSCSNQLPENELLWECDGEYVEGDRSSPFEPMEMPPGNNELVSIFDESDTEEQMLLVAGDLVEFVSGIAYGTVPEAHNLPARSRHQVSTACEGDTTGEPLLFETSERTETPIPADAYYCLLTESEMLFDADL